MELTASLDPAGRPAERPLALAYLNSLYETGIKSPLDEAMLRRGGSADGFRKVDDPLRLRAPACRGGGDGVDPVRWTVNCFRDRHGTSIEGDTNMQPLGRSSILRALCDRRSDATVRKSWATGNRARNADGAGCTSLR